MTKLILAILVSCSVSVFAADGKQTPQAKKAPTPPAKVTKAKTMMMPNVLPGAEGKAYGFSFASIESGSTWDKAGIQSGDLVIEINGKPTNSQAEMKEAMASLKGIKGNVKVKIDRDGEKKDIEVAQPLKYH